MSTTPTFEDTFTTLSLWNGSSGLWQPAYDWSPDGYMDSSMSSWLVNPAYGPTSEADADVYSINSNGLNMAIKPLPADVSASAVGGAQFLSGQLTTQPSFSQEYGYFQVTAELPTATSGISSAFWLLPESGAWPPEIDIFEADGSQGPNAIETGVFTGSSSDPQQTYQWDYSLPNLTTSYNTFALNWTATTMTWYVDGQAVYQIATPSQMNQPMYILLDDLTNSAGDWNGAAPAGYTGNMSIQSVYVFDNMADAETAGVVPGVAGSGTGSGSTGTGSTGTGSTGTGSTGTGSTGTGSTGTGSTGTGSTGTGSTGTGSTGTGSTGSTGTDPAPVTVGTGPDQLIVTVSEDPYVNGDGTSDANGDAAFTISVDGTQVGSKFIATAINGSGETQQFILNGDWGTGSQTVTIDYLNYVYGGPSDPDVNGSWGRNLYIDGISYNGVNQNETDSLYGDGPVNFTVSGGTGSTGTGSTGTGSTGTGSTGTGSTGTGSTGTGSTGTGSTGTGSTGTGSTGTGSTGTGSTGTGSTGTGSTGTGSTGTGSTGTGSTGTGSTGSTGTDPAPVTVGTGPDQLIVTVSEDPYVNGDGTSDANGDAAFTISVDGTQVGSKFIATAINGSGETQQFILNGDWGTGSQTVTIDYLNYVYGGPSDPDVNGSWGRNLYIDGISYNGVNQNETDSLYGDGPVNFTVSGGTGSTGTGSTGTGSTGTGSTGTSLSPQDLTVAVPASEKLVAGTTIAISGVSATDPWAAANPGTLALNVWDSTGTLSVDGKSVAAASGPVAGGMFSGTLAQIDADLASLTYTASASGGSDTISINVWNQAGVEVTETIPVTVTAATITIAASNANPVESVSNDIITATSGNHMLFVGGTGDTVTLTGGTETVKALEGHNTITTGGQNDTIQIAGTGNVVNAGAGQNIIDDNGSANTIVLPAAQDGNDSIYGSVMKNGDTFDLRALLAATSWKGSQSTIGDFIRMSTSNNSAVISVTPTGAVSGGKYAVATLENSGSVSLSTLLAHSIT